MQLVLSDPWARAAAQPHRYQGTPDLGSFRFTFGYGKLTDVQYGIDLSQGLTRVADVSMVQRDALRRCWLALAGVLLSWCLHLFRCC